MTSSFCLSTYLALGILGAGIFLLDAEGVSTEVVALSLQQVGWQILCAETVEEG